MRDEDDEEEEDNDNLNADVDINDAGAFLIVSSSDDVPGCVCVHIISSRTSLQITDFIPPMWAIQNL